MTCDHGLLLATPHRHQHQWLYTKRDISGHASKDAPLLYKASRQGNLFSVAAMSQEPIGSFPLIP